MHGLARVRMISKPLAVAALAFAALLLGGMGGKPPRSVMYSLSAHESWPVVSLVRLDGHTLGPDTAECCLDIGRPGGAGSVTLYPPDTGDPVTVFAVWMEVATQRTYKASAKLPADEDRVELLIRPNGALDLLVPNAALRAATPTGPVTTPEEMRAMLTAPGLGRPEEFGDFDRLARICAEEASPQDWMDAFLGNDLGPIAEQPPESPCPAQ